MKKLFLTLIASLLFIFNVNAQASRPWYENAIIDGAGALGGAASVATFLNLGSLTPWGWAAIGGGAVLGGAGATIGANSSTATPPTQTVTTPNMTNSLNTIDHVGAKHNIATVEYFAQHRTFTPATYYNFMMANQARYGVSNEYISLQFIEAQHNEVLALRTFTDLINFSKKSLPAGVSQTDFINFLNSLQNSTVLSTFLTKVTTYENSVLRSNISDSSKAVMSGYFSTLRHSACLWAQ